MYVHYCSQQRASTLSYNGPSLWRIPALHVTLRPRSGKSFCSCFKDLQDKWLPTLRTDCSLPFTGHLFKCLVFSPQDIFIYCFGLSTSFTLLSLHSSVFYFGHEQTVVFFWRVFSVLFSAEIAPELSSGCSYRYH